MGTRTLQCYTIAIDGECLCRHGMGSWLRWRCSLTQCHFLCGYDSLSGFAYANQSGGFSVEERRFHQLTPQEQSAQKEEAFARATVALTRAQQICMIMGPLDMRGLVGAATIMGCLKYGVCFCGFYANDQPQLQLLLKDADLPKRFLIVTENLLLIQSTKSGIEEIGFASMVQFNGL